MTLLPQALLRLTKRSNITSFEYEAFCDNMPLVCSIIFENGKFVRANIPPQVGTWSREKWRLLAEINDSISSIEKELAPRNFGSPGY